MRKQETMRRTIRKDGLALLQHSEQAQSGAITEAQVLGLPEPLQRYLHYAQVVGKAPIRTVRLTQHGFMRMQPDQKWLPMIAQQYFTTAPPAFLWNTTIQPFPLVSISATDRFSDGHGSMRIQSSRWAMRVDQKWTRGSCSATCLKWLGS